MGTDCHYDILDIPPWSGESEIKKAFHRIARLNHPDRAANGNVELFKRATIAYETLSDPDKRHLYDRELRQTEPWRWQATPQASPFGSPSGTIRSVPRGSTSAANFFTSTFTSSFSEPGGASKYFASTSTVRTTAFQTTTPSAEASAAAFAAFRNSESQEPAEATYRKRPQKTRFSTRASSPVKEAEDARRADTPTSTDRDPLNPSESRPKTADEPSNSFDDPLLKRERVPGSFGDSIDINSPYSRQTKRPMPSEEAMQGSKRFKTPRTKSVPSADKVTGSETGSETGPEKEPEEVIDLTNSPPEDVSSPPPSSSAREYLGKRPAEQGDDDEDEGEHNAEFDGSKTPNSPNKKQRTFDFSELKEVPPFTQKHGTSFSFNDVNEAIVSSIDDLGSTRWPRQYNGRYNAGEQQQQKQQNTAAAADSSHNLSAEPGSLFNQYTSESSIEFDKLFRLHNERIELLEEPDKVAIFENLVKTEGTLAKLLQGTREVLSTFQG